MATELEEGCLGTSGRPAGCQTVSQARKKRKAAGHIQFPGRVTDGISNVNNAIERQWMICRMNNHI